MATFGLNVNLVSFCGRLADDPEIQTSAKGNDWCRIQLLCPVGKDGDNVPIEITCFGASAGVAGELRRGQLIVAKCELRPGLYQSKKGQSYPRLELNMIAFGVLPAAAQAEQDADQVAAARKAKEERRGDVAGDYDSVPF